MTKHSAGNVSRLRHYDGSKAERMLCIQFRKADEAVANVAGFYAQH